MTGKKECAQSVESLLEDLKTRIRLDLQDKEEPDVKISDVYKELAERNMLEVNQTSNRSQKAVGYVLQDGISFRDTQREPTIANTCSESMSSFCDSHLCHSCESGAYDSDCSSQTSPHNQTCRHGEPATSRCHLTTHRTSSRHSIPNRSEILPHDNLRACYSDTSRGNRTSLLTNIDNHGVSIPDRGSASDTSGVSSHDIRIKLPVTSDSETQTDIEPPPPLTTKSVEFASDTEHLSESQSLFYLDRYTHLTKRKRNRGIPNVCQWFGMGAVEHLIQNSVNVNSWLWVRPRQAKVTPKSHPAIQTVSENSPKSLSSDREPVERPKLCEIDEWESEKSLLDVMSDIGEQILDNLSPANSRRGSNISITSIASATPKQPKKKRSNRLGLPSTKKLDTFKNSIISRVYSPQPNRKTTSKNGQSNGGILLPPDKFLPSENFRNGEREEDEESKSSDANSSLKPTEKLVEAQKRSTLVEIINEELNDDDADLQKKKQRKKGGGRGFRGGSTMMKCALFDEFVDFSKSKGDDESASDCRRSPKATSGSSSQLERCIQIRDENQSLSR